jgi:hypothetical protein
MTSEEVIIVIVNLVCYAIIVVGGVYLVYTYLL